MMAIAQELPVDAQELTTSPCLPPGVANLIAIVGPDATADLINAFGGTSLPISLNRNQAGQRRFDALAEVAGLEAATTLTKHYGGDTLYVPRGDRLRRHVRNHRVRNDFDTLTRQYSALDTVAMLSVKYRMSDRHVWRILKTA